MGEILGYERYKSELINRYEVLNSLIKSNNSETKTLGEKIIKMIYLQYVLIKSPSDIPISQRKHPYLDTIINLEEQGCYGYVNTVTEDRTILPYMIIFPKKLPDNKEVVVDTLNSSSTRDPIAVAIKGAIMLGGYSRLSNNNSPILYILIPDDFGNRPYYQQLSRECFTQTDLEYPRIDLKIKNTILNAQDRISNVLGKSIPSKVTLSGYSTSRSISTKICIYSP